MYIQKRLLLVVTFLVSILQVNAGFKFWKKFKWPRYDYDEDIEETGGVFEQLFGWFKPPGPSAYKQYYDKKMEDLREYDRQRNLEAI